MLRDESMETIKPVPQRRIIDKMNDYMSRMDYRGAERHLQYWLEEAELGRDLQGQLMLRNEMVGHCRKTGQKEKAMESAEKALALLAELEMEDSISAGTTYVNIATACNAFGEYGRSMELFERARRIYESSPYTEPQLLGGLYNNMALTCTALGRFEEALELYEKALPVMAGVPDGELEQAITYLNMADAIEAQAGMEKGESRILALADRAEDLLEQKSRELLGQDDALLGEKSSEAFASLGQAERARLGYYAFVCGKCAPVFAYYGYFMAAERLEERSKAVVRGLERTI